jgi:DUF1680 family protein
MISRRQILLSSAALLATPLSNAEAGTLARVEPFPLEAVRLKDSIFKNALEANRVYLLSLEPDRLLHNYRLYAGLQPKGAIYGGWESETISGHSLGHYLSACALMFAQTGDAECRSRVRYIVGELAACQEAGGDGYVAGFTRRTHEGRIEAGRLVLDEVSRGDIRPQRFDLNGAWSPFYNVHKVFAGLLDAHRYCAEAGALDVAKRFASYIETKLSPLSEAQMQHMLECEHGGMMETLAELSARAKDPRWKSLAGRFYHKAVLDPLTERRDALAYLHANTQIPKVIGLARMRELTGEARFATGADFFWRTVTETRSYVIGGNSDREYFQSENTLSHFVTEQTCESCNSYNMLKLTRLEYARRPEARHFDYYERAHLNHIMAQHRAQDGAFAYMIPLMSGSAREWSTPTDTFWCCCGTGMESHAKHGDSIYWRDANSLFVNLYIPSELSWAERNARIALETDYPHAPGVRLLIESLATPQRFTIALRVPSWCRTPSVRVNQRPVAGASPREGYIRLTRTWQANDRIELDLPMRLRLEATPDDASVVAALYGPLVLAADLGAASNPYAGPDPSFISSNPLTEFVPVAPERGLFRRAGLSFAPFYAMHDRRTGVYFKRRTQGEEDTALRADRAARERQRAIDAASFDIVKLGDENDEKARHLRSDISYPVSYRRHIGRDARDGGFFEFDARVGEGALSLRCTYWADERDKWFHIAIDGQRIATQRLNGSRVYDFIDVDYSVPPELTRGKTQVRVKIEPEPGSRAGPVFGVRVLRA